MPFAGKTSMNSHGNPAATLSTRRVLSAPPHAVFSAFQAPERLARWWGPAGFTNTFRVFEFHSGGRWIFDMQGPTGINYPNESRFREIQSPSRIVIEHLAKPWYRLTISIREETTHTLLTWDQEFESPEVADRFRPLCTPANEQNLDRLEVELAREPLQPT